MDEEEPNHVTARKPGLLFIIQYSLEHVYRDLIYRVEVVPGGGGLTDGPGAQVQDLIAVPPDLSVELHYSALRPVTHTSTGQDQRYCISARSFTDNAGTVPH